MISYAIMISPRHKRVYMERSQAIAINELIFTGGLLSQPVNNIREAEIGGLPYLLFDGERAFLPQDIRRLSRLSFTYAIFELRYGLLAPVEIDCGYFIDEDISSILKYTGKTNELFTRLMINLALSHHSQPETVKLLDPMAGKGTTLYEGLMQNCDVYGIEIDPKPAYESFVYIKKHLEMAKYKHSNHTEKTGGVDASGKKFAATRYQVELSRSKEAQRAGQTHQFEIIAGDTRHTRAFYKKSFFHAIVADLPYGVQHGAKNRPQVGMKAGVTRNAMGLLHEALPEWIKALKPGGVIVLAWNLFLIPRSEMEGLFAEHGLVVPEGIKGLDFSHRLDQATHRDLVLGKLQ